MVLGVFRVYCDYTCSLTRVYLVREDARARADTYVMKTGSIYVRLPKTATADLDHSTRQHSQRV